MQFISRRKIQVIGQRRDDCRPLLLAGSDVLQHSRVEIIQRKPMHSAAVARSVSGEEETPMHPGAIIPRYQGFLGATSYRISKSGNFPVVDFISADGIPPRQRDESRRLCWKLGCEGRIASFFTFSVGFF